MGSQGQHKPVLKIIHSQRGRDPTLQSKPAHTAGIESWTGHEGSEGERKGSHPACESVLVGGGCS